MLKIGKNSEFDKLSWQRQKAIVQLFNGKTLKEISQDVKVHINTVENWKNDPKFQQAQIEYSTYAFGHLLPQVVTQLNRILKYGEDKDVLQAIRIILDNGEMLNSESSKQLEKAQIKRAQAEAVRAEAEADVAKAQAQRLHTVADKTAQKMDRLSTEDLRKLASMVGGDDNNGDQS